ncbi:hypothetical protein ACMYSK_23745 [Klebsiella sp. I138]|uniref:hypothetical protein n=1 Tax=Klebsiella sp. I138 TaxID=2755385 RepID=UPI003DA94C1A
MNKKNYILITIALFVITSGTVLFFYHSANQAQILSCQSRHTLLHSGFTLDATYSFIFGEKDGELNINGIATEDGESHQVSRLIHYSYHKERSVYSLQSTNVEYLSRDNSRDSNVDHHYLSFFREKGKALTLKIERDIHGVPVIYMHDIPIFYCGKRDKNQP